MPRGKAAQTRFWSYVPTVDSAVLVAQITGNMIDGECVKVNHAHVIYCNFNANTSKYGARFHSANWKKPL